MKNKAVYIIKLGGSVISDKNKPFSFNYDVVYKLIEEIKKSNAYCIIIHGGGSFGHPVAKKFDIVNGINPEIENQILGFAETHKVMIELNLKIAEVFSKQQIPAISLQSSAIFYLNPDLEFYGLKRIENLLNLGVIPMLYGDIILDSTNNFTILSGDKIIYSICNSIKKAKETTISVKKVIFLTDQDGIFTMDNESEKILVENLSADEIPNLQLSKFDSKIDVTRSIKGKLEEIGQICKLGIKVQLVNGFKENYLTKSLKDEKIPSTTIFQKK
jgi:isopentenyl phosphate kinase